MDPTRLALMSLCLATSNASGVATVQLPPNQPFSDGTVEARNINSTDLEQQREDSYALALDNLAAVLERYPEAESVIQSLQSQPALAYAMFDGCTHYRPDLQYRSGSASEDWDTREALLYYQRIPEKVKQTHVYTIEPDKSLIVLTCGSAPYWTAYANYIYDETHDSPQFMLLTVPIYDSENGQVIQGQSNLSHGIRHYDAASRTLTLSHQNDLMGSCGHQATYRLENDELTLTEFREQKICGEARSPDEFPQVYP
ncbi:MAG: hypothetical protein AAGG53_13445 [Cyanobacteria bacterium P01_H01_bin.152]